MKRVISILLLLGSLYTLKAQEADTTLLTQETSATPSVKSLWDEANTAYLRSDFRSAIRIYESILEQGLASAKLYYNLGNAYFKDGKTGRAILNYQRALRLKPGDEDILYNLSVAEKQTVDRIETIPDFFLNSWFKGVRNLLSERAWTIASLVLLSLTLSLLLLFLLAQRMVWRKSGFYGTVIALLLLLATTLFAASNRKAYLDHSQAVILSSAVSVKSSPDRSATDLFVLHEGTLVKVGDQIGDWSEVTLADGKKGWLEMRHLEAI